MTALAHKRKRTRSFERKLEKTAYLVIAPAAILLIVFCIVPMAASFFVSTQKMGVDLSKAEYVGFSNFTKALSDRRFIDSIRISLRCRDALQDRFIDPFPSEKFQHGSTPLS